MGSEATIRYLKARLVVMEEELAGAIAAAREKEDKVAELAQRNKELEEERTRSGKAADAAKVCMLSAMCCTLPSHLGALCLR